MTYSEVYQTTSSKTTAALSDADGDCQTSTIKLHYWPEDVLSEYAMDLPFFCANAEFHPCKVKVQPSPDGAVFKIE